MRFCIIRIGANKQVFYQGKLLRESIPLIVWALTIYCLIPILVFNLGLCFRGDFVQWRTNVCSISISRLWIFCICNTGEKCRSPWPWRMCSSNSLFNGCDLSLLPGHIMQSMDRFWRQSSMGNWFRFTYDLQGNSSALYLHLINWLCS